MRQLNFINEEINPILRELIEKIKPNSIKAAEAEPYDMLNEIKLYFRKFGDSLEEVVEL